MTGDDEVRLMLRRAQLVSLDDSGSQQLLDLLALKSDRPRKVPLVGMFGITSVPPAGANYLLLGLGGGASRAMAFGGEHGDYRPKNTPAGGTVVYDAYGDIISIVEQNIRVVHATEVSIEAPSVTIKGALTVTQTFSIQNLDGAAQPAIVNGSIDVTGDVTAGGVSLKNHAHALPGGGSTSAPTV